jgi:hypothetical protein
MDNRSIVVQSRLIKYGHLGRIAASKKAIVGGSLIQNMHSRRRDRTFGMWDVSILTRNWEIRPGSVAVPRVAWVACLHEKVYI